TWTMPPSAASPSTTSCSRTWTVAVRVSLQMGSSASPTSPASSSLRKRPNDERVGGGTPIMACRPVVRKVGAAAATRSVRDQRGDERTPTDHVTAPAVVRQAYPVRRAVPGIPRPPHTVTAPAGTLRQSALHEPGGGCWPGGSSGYQMWHEPGGGKWPWGIVKLRPFAFVTSMPP